MSLTSKVVKVRVVKASKMLSKDRASGFTLMEVLIAMAVFAVMSAAMATATQRNAEYASRLEEKSVGHWIAMNKMSELKGKGGWPNLGSIDQEVAMARREWLVTTKVTASQVESFRVVEVSVALQEQRFAGGSRRVSLLKTLMTQSVVKDT